MTLWIFGFCCGLFIRHLGKFARLMLRMLNEDIANKRFWP